MTVDLHAMSRRGRGLLGRFRRDQSGNYLIIAGLAMPALVGIVGLGTDYGLWSYTHQSMQSATDSSALSAATAYAKGDYNIVTKQANAVAATYGFVNGAGGVVVTVNRPPASGAYTAKAGAVEVIIKQPQTPKFSAVAGAKPFDITARSVALGEGDGKGCVLSLSKAASGAAISQGTAAVDLKACSLYDNSADASALKVDGSATLSALSVHVVGGISGQAGITTTKGVETGTQPALDPYAGVTMPTPTGPVDANCCKKNETLKPGIYTGGMKIAGDSDVTLEPGVYFIEGSGLEVQGGGSLTGTGVTLVFTTGDGGKTWANATINGGASVNLTAPTTGPLAGLTMFGDRNMPVGTVFKMNGGATQTFTGALYLPKAAVAYSGGADTATGCTQLIGDTVNFSGNPHFAIDCTGKGTKPLGLTAVTLKE
jgi:Flp pilus assembly protein TadG